MTTSSLENLTNSDPPASTSSDLIPLVTKLLRVYHHRKKALFTTIYCFAIVGVVYYFVATRLYESSAKLLIVEQKLDRVSAVGDHDSIGKTMATHRELVTSPIVIEKAIKQLAPEHRVDLYGVPPSEWIETITSQLSAKISRKTNFIEVTYQSRNPDTAVAVVRSVIRSYLDFVAKNHKGTAGEIVEVLSEERNQLQGSLNELQATLQRKRREVGHISVSADDGIIDPMIQRAVSLNEALLETQEKRLSLQATLVSVEQALDRGEDISQQLMGVEENLGQQLLLSSMGLSQQDMEVLGSQQKQMLDAQKQLQSLSTDLGPNHPRIIELKTQIKTYQNYLSSYHAEARNRLSLLGKSAPTEVILNMLRQSARQALQQEQQLSDSFELARSKASQHSDALVQLHMIERDVARKEALYDSLSDKIANFDITQVQAPIKATVVREPVSGQSPVTPQLRFVAFACLLGGSLAGSIIMYVQDLLDDRFNSPEELSSQLGVPVLAMVQDLEPLPGEGMDTVHINSMPNAVETEAFRTLRTSLSVGNDICDRILISSSEPGDGKTTISANLSVAFAQAGKRTLVIDADLRKPGFTKLLNLKGQPGMADVLTSDLPIPEIAASLVQGTSVDGLDVLPVGQRRPNPSELLSSSALVELLAWADSRYDRVIVDCPPILAVSDAQIVGQLVDGAILVVRPEKNPRQSVVRAVDSFRASGCGIFGIVANGLSADSMGYGYGYGYGYSDGYGHEEEELDNTSNPVFTEASIPPLAIHSETVNDGTHSTASNTVEPPIQPRRAA